MTGIPPVQGRISGTAIYVAIGRALGAREPDPAARNPDHLAERLLGDPSRIELDHPMVGALLQPYDEAMRAYDVVSNVRMMTVRTRFIDETVARAVADGASQVVILGAGLDTHAYRSGELLDDVRIFEVDHPETQRLKRDRVRACLGGPPDNLVYVPADFGSDGLSVVLEHHGADRDKKTLFVLEGVTMYLPEADVLRILDVVARYRPGSRIVFDFVTAGMIEMIRNIDMSQVPEAGRTFFQRFLDLTRDEPWIFGIPLGNEREFLERSGLELTQLLSVRGPEAVRRYLTRADGTEVGAQTIAETMARMAAQSPAPPDEDAAREMREAQRQMTHQIAVAEVR